MGKRASECLRNDKRLARSVQFLQRIYYESGEPVWLVTDASSKGVGGYVAQGKDWRTAQPIRFYSRQYRSSESNYLTHEQEMLAIVQCMKHWYPQLTGIQFTVLIDHALLQHWKTQRDLSKRQLRWLDLLCNFDFDIKYIPGVTNTTADALSHYPFAQVNTILDISFSLIVTKRIAKVYTKDPFFQPILKTPKHYPFYKVNGNGLLCTKDGQLCVPNCQTTRELL